jgi:ABC-type multidrug transport system permease subunit
VVSKTISFLVLWELLRFISVLIVREISGAISVFVIGVLLQTISVLVIRELSSQFPHGKDRIVLEMLVYLPFSHLTWLLA